MGHRRRTSLRKTTRTKSESRRSPARIRPIAEAAAKLVHRRSLQSRRLGREPENQIKFHRAAPEHSPVTNVGIGVTQHHGHAHVERFPELLAKMSLSFSRSISTA